jgi:hypothetical protein
MATDNKAAAMTDSRSEILLFAAKPDLFRKNAFRVTGLPVEATAGDVARQSDRLRMAEKYGGGNRLPSALPLTPPPDADQVREAVDRLRDPERRLVDEFFWFWPNKLGGSKDDEALSALRRGEEDHAVAAWQRQESSQSISNVSMHNLAVLMHTKALDLEFQKDGAPIDVRKRAELWESAYKRWRVLLDDEGFWSRLTARIRDIDDPRLTTGTARRMKSSLPLALLMIHAQLVVRSAEAGNAGDAQWHLGVMKGAGFGDAVVQDALRQAVDPLRDRIKTSCQAADKETDPHPERGAEVAEQLLAQTGPLLAALDRVLPAGDPLRDGMHDEVAIIGLRCQIAFGNKTQNWKKSVALLEMILPIAVGAPARARIQENLQIVRANREFNLCFFCSDNNGDEKCGVDKKMYGDVKRTPTFIGYRMGTRITWNKRTVTVPRCRNCASAHHKSGSWGTAAWLTSLITGIASCNITHNLSPDNGSGLIMFLVFGIGGGLLGDFLAGRYFAKGILPKTHAMKSPRIQDLLKSGWHVGTGPNQRA